jgi:hypothetical protein|tara:strand:+ start:422 stop:832 length:411 start_codon:yes stop_codon:yes gene_type:complete
MSRIIRTVSLDPKSDELASKKSNFSAWVRKSLQEEASKVQYYHINETLFLERGICNPTASPRCGLCFPYGKPKLEDSKLFNQGIISKDELQNRTKNLYDGVIPIIEETPDEKEHLTPPKPERKYLRRLVKWLIEWI